MRLGAVFPQSEIGADSDAIRRFAEAVETFGYDHLLIFDHVLGIDRPEYQAATGTGTFGVPIHEPFVLFGYLAAVTRQIELVTGVLVLPQRQTALVAKQAAEVDVLSRGRLRLGVGVGWVPDEFVALNAEYHDRGARSEEQIAVLRALWTEPTVTFEGRWHRIAAAGINPSPVRRPIPIWIGGMAEATLERIGRIGDGWIPLPIAPDAEARAMIDRLRGYTRAAGRVPEAVGVQAFMTFATTPPGEAATHAAAWEQLGATHLAVSTIAAGFTTAEEHIDALRRTMSALRR